VTTLPYMRTRDRSKSRSQWTTERTIGILLALDGLAVISLWTLSLTSGAFGGMAGLFVYQDGNFPALHVTAEVLMGVLSIVSGIGLTREQSWARGLALVAVGMLGYSSINSAGWPLRNDPNLLVPIVATALLVLFSAPLLLNAFTRSRLDS
jgi:hypothetical protein